MQQLHIMAAPHALRIVKDAARSQYVVRIGNVTRFMEMRIDEQQLHSSYSAIDLIVGTIEKLKWEMNKEMNDYPDVRRWAFEHLNGVDSNILGSSVSIPGWVWPKWNAAHPGMKAIKEGGIEPVAQYSINNPILKNKTTPKKIVRTKGVGTRDPSRIKRPLCPVHNEAQMKFNAVRELWECSVDSCNLIARPKNEPSQGEVTLGKGNVTLRVVCQENAPAAYILISDDNIALDVTDLIYARMVHEQFGMDNVTEDTTVSNISIPVAGDVKLFLKASITNAEYYRPLP